MPWTADNPPRPAKNWSEGEKKKCVAAANAVKSKGGSDEEAIYACIHAAGKSKKAAVGTLAKALQKVGARHGVVDRGHLNIAHNAVAALVDGMHCGTNKTSDEDMSKANARHAKVDLARIKSVHDALIELGASCPGVEE